MNVLIITNAAWDTRNSLGNTLSNWFTGWEGCQFSCITYRSDLPNNNCCSEYYVIPPFNIIRNLLRPKRIGIRYDSTCIPTDSNRIEANVKGISGFKRYIIRFLVDIVYRLPIWRNQRYKRFLHDINPDIVFLFAIPESFVYSNVNYIKKHTNAKIAMTIEDDVYGVVSSKLDPLSALEKYRLKRMFRMADKLYGASQMMCDNYSHIFRKDFAPIYKGCEFGSLKDKINSPIEVVYAGNLLYGRLDTLSTIAKTIRAINKDNVQIRLTVFSGTKLSEEQKLCINDGVNAVFAGVKPYEYIKDVLEKSDVTLHVESFEKKMQSLVRYSFSTKIIDCLQSGNTLMVVGPPNIASVEYPRTIPGAIVVDNVDNIPAAFKDIVSHPESLIVRAKDINQFSKQRHSISSVRNAIRNDFQSLLA